MRPNSKKEYYTSARTKSYLDELPSFIKKGTDSILFKLSNPQNVEFDRYFSDIENTALNLNPMSLDLSLPDFLYGFFDLASGIGITGAPAALQEVSLYDFTFNIPTRGGSATSLTAIQGVSGATYINMHYVAPITYTDDDNNNVRLDSGYIGLREGTWLTPDLITVFDDDLIKVKSFSLPSFSQDLDSSEDEWIKLDENLTYTLNQPYLIEGSIQVINPHTQEVFTNYNLINGTLYFFQDPNMSLVVEYSYVPSPLLHSIYYSNRFHDIELSDTSSSENPTGFLFIPTDQLGLIAGISADAEFAQFDNVLRNVTNYTKKINDDTSDLKLRFKANEITLESTVNCDFTYYATYSYDLHDNTNQYWGHDNAPPGNDNHWLIVNEFIDGPNDKILINGIKIIYTPTGADITDGFTITDSGASGVYITRLYGTVDDDSMIYIPYAKDITASATAEVYSEAMFDVFSVTTAGTSADFYLNRPYISGGTSDYYSNITLPILLEKQFTVNTIGANLDVGATFGVTYEGLSHESIQQNKLWADNGVTIPNGSFASGAGASGGPTFTDELIDIQIKNVSTIAKQNKAVVYYPELIHSVDNYFELVSFSLNSAEGIIEVYTESDKTLFDKYPIYSAAYDSTSLAGIETYYTSLYPGASGVGKEPIGIQLFHDSIAFVEEDIATHLYNLVFKDVHSLNTLLTLDSLDKGTTFDSIKSFSFDSDNNLQLFSGATAYTLPLFYDYYTVVTNSETNTQSIYFREDYESGVTITGGTGATYDFPERETAVVEHSVDHWGRVFGSDRWPRETLKAYLVRLTNITTAKGVSSYQKALDGISATLGVDSYNINSKLTFNLPYSAATVIVKEQSPDDTTSTERTWYLDYPIDTATPSNGAITSVYLTNATGEHYTSTTLKSNLVLTNNAPTGAWYAGVSGATAGAISLDLADEAAALAMEAFNLNVEYSLEDYLTMNGGETAINQAYYSVSVDNILEIDSQSATGASGEYSINYTYWARTDYNAYDSIFDAENNIHKYTYTSDEGRIRIEGQDTQITINDFLNSSYLDGQTTEGILGATAINLLKLGTRKSLFKWGEFKWDNYRWEDGESIQQGLPTTFDAGVTASTPGDPKFTSGVAAGDHIKFLGFDKNDKGIVRPGQFYYKDKEYYLGTNMGTSSFPVANGYQDVVLWNEGATSELDLPISQTPIFVQRDTPNVLYVVQNATIINSVNSVPTKEDLGDYTTFSANLIAYGASYDSHAVNYDPYGGVTGDDTLGEYEGGTTDAGFEVFIIGASGGTGGSADYIQYLDGVQFTNNGGRKLLFTPEHLATIAEAEAGASSGTPTADTIYLSYVYGSDRRVAIPGPADSPPDTDIVPTDNNLYHAVDETAIDTNGVTGTVYSDMNEILTSMTGPSDDYFMIDNAAKKINITDTAWYAGGTTNQHIFSFDYESGDEYIINNLTLNNEQYNIGNKILALGNEELLVDSIDIKVSNSIIDKTHNTIRISIEARDSENGCVNNALFSISGATFSNDGCITKEDGLGIIDTSIIQAPTGDISIGVSYLGEQLQTFLIHNLGDV